MAAGAPSPSSQGCGKSCRLRWTNYLRPDIKRGPFTADERKSILHLHAIVGNRWSTIAAQLPGRTDNEIKNYWNTHLKKRLPAMNPIGLSAASRHMAQWESVRLEAEAGLSRRTFLFEENLSGAAGPSAPTPSAAASEAKPYFFLRVWNSDVGDAFRRSSAGESSSAAKEDTESKSRVTPAADDSSGPMRQQRRTTRCRKSRIGCCWTSAPAPANTICAS